MKEELTECLYWMVLMVMVMMIMMVGKNETYGMTVSLKMR